MLLGIFQWLIGQQWFVGHQQRTKWQQRVVWIDLQRSIFGRLWRFFGVTWLRVVWLSRQRQFRVGRVR